MGKVETLMGRDATEAAAKRAVMDRETPGWRDKRYPSGRLMFADDGTMMEDSDERRRSIFDDVDE